MFESKSDLDKEKNRLAVLYRYNILDTPAEETFDRITRVAKKALDTSIVLLNFLDHDRQWFKSRQGTKIQETKRNISFCRYTIQQNEPLMVHDLRKDDRFSKNPFVAGLPFLRFYCGVPLTTHDGYNIGTLCILDRKKRRLSEEEIAVLVDLARLAMDEIELHDMTRIDCTTGIATRRVLFDEGERLFRTSAENPFWVLAFDIDHFKKINQKYGFQTGNHVLRQIVERCKALVRPGDILARVGGEEFVLLMPNTTLEEAQDILQKMATAIRSEPIVFEGNSISITCSFGLIACRIGDAIFAGSFNRAFAYLMKAKRGGRDRAVVLNPQTDSETPITFSKNKSTLLR